MLICGTRINIATKQLGFSLGLAMLANVLPAALSPKLSRTMAASLISFWTGLVVLDLSLGFLRKRAATLISFSELFACCGLKPRSRPNYDDPRSCIRFRRRLPRRFRTGHNHLPSKLLATHS